jgi:rSAM/selenodomain-associated transferase 1
LIPALGTEGAARLQQQLTERALRTAVGAAGARVTLWVAGDPAHPFIAAMARRFSAGVEQQQGGDLGARMHRAFVQTAAPLVLIGTDCPQLRPDDLASAAALLADNDAVVQPAADGGYVLIALRKPQADLFDAIPWGGSEVLQQTLRRAAAAGLRCALRPTLHDLDTPEDLQRALLEGWVAPLAGGGRAA